MEELTIPIGLTNVKPIREIIYDHLRQSILDGIIKPGERLIERDIAEKYTVSRTPVREALRKLESEGYLEHVPRKGDVVRGFNIGEIQEIYDIRKALECLAIRGAIANITNQEIEMLQIIVEQLEKEKDIDPAKTTLRGLHEFDEVLFKTAKMPLLSSFINTLQESLTRYRKINLSQTPRRKTAIGEHKAILQALIDQDVEQAEKLVCLHIERARTALLEGLKQEQ